MPDKAMANISAAALGTKAGGIKKENMATNSTNVNANYFQVVAKDRLEDQISLGILMKLFCFS